MARICVLLQYDVHGSREQWTFKDGLSRFGAFNLCPTMDRSCHKEDEIDIQIESIDWRIKNLPTFATSDTKGIFQFEQPGAISLLKRVHFRLFLKNGVGQLLFE